MCIGAAPCVVIAKDVFQLDEEGKAIVIGTSKDEANIKLAAGACPVYAIFLYDDDKNQIYPDPKEVSKPYEEQNWPTAANNNATDTNSNKAA